MNDFKVIACLMAAIRASEESPVFDTSLVDKKVLEATEVQRDILAMKLYKERYIEGLNVAEAADEAPHIGL